MKKFILLLFTLVSVAGFSQYPLVYPGLVWSEKFDNAFSVSRNGATNTGVTFVDGKGVFNGSAYLNYGTQKGRLTQSGSIRVRIRPNDGQPSAAQTIVGKFNITGNQREWVLSLNASGRIGFYTSANGSALSSCLPISANFTNGNQTVFTDVVVVYSFSGTGQIYINGVSVPMDGTSAIAASIFKSTSNMDIGRRGDGDAITYFSGDIDLVEQYNRQLTASEVANLYNNSWNVPIPNSATTLLNYQSYLGVASESTGKTLTQSNISYVQNGSFKSAKWNGTTSYISTTGDGLMGNVTVWGWFKAFGWGGGSGGRIFDNSQIKIFVEPTSPNGRLRLTRNAGATYVSTPSYTLFESKIQFFALTSTSTGSSYIYLADTKNAPIQSVAGSAGTPVSGTTWYIGDRGDLARVFNGLIPEIHIENKIMTLAEITQAYTSTLKNYR